MVELSRISLKITSALNSTFVALISKKSKPLIFNDFRLISLCDLLYKLISKIIVLMLRDKLDVHFSLEQFGFLKHFQIHDAIAIAQNRLKP